jgi:hypothetical protein
MRKPKFLLKVDHNNVGKVYVNRKWIKDVAEITVHGKPFDYSITIKQYKRNEKGVFWVENGEVAAEEKIYTIKEKND